jgi:hypothetical protein
MIKGSGLTKGWAVRWPGCLTACLIARTSVPDPDPNPDLDPPDPRVFWPPGSGSRSTSQRYGSGSGRQKNTWIRWIQIRIRIRIRNTGPGYQASRQTARPSDGPAFSQPSNQGAQRLGGPNPPPPPPSGSPEGDTAIGRPMLRTSDGPISGDSV